MHNEETPIEKAVLVAIDMDPADGEFDPDLNELELLAATDGAETVGKLIQKREAPHPGTYIGKGKLEELRDLISLTEAGCIIFDDELSPAQHKNLNRILEVKIIDRTMLILDIFAMRAISAEGKAQVETARLKYRLSHLSGLGAALSRLGGGSSGGIGARRGSGETKMETDKRHIKNRLNQLNAELKEISVQRGVNREKRMSSGIPVVSMVGYTNSGKSTLMNALTNAGVLAEDKLFATLDTTTRKSVLKSRETDNSQGMDVLFTDTVGFIRKLPHHLIQAFRATLEELGSSDILIHVVDISNDAAADQMKVVYDTLDSLGYGQKPVITVYNKIDAPASGGPYPTDARAAARIPLSAKTGENIDLLYRELENLIQKTRNKIHVLIPYNEGRLVETLHRRCEITREEHTEEGTYAEVFCDDQTKSKLAPYIVPEKI